MGGARPKYSSAGVQCGCSLPTWVHNTLCEQGGWVVALHSCPGSHIHGVVVWPHVQEGGRGGAREVDGGPKYSFAELMSSPTHPRWVYYNHVGACF